MRLVAVATLMGLLALPAPAAEISGPVKVVDGDTVKVLGHSQRLRWIDAFEKQQGAAGRISAEAMKVIAGERVVCHLAAGKDAYGRDLSECFNDAGQSINLAILAAGQALAYWPFRDVNLNRLPCPSAVMPECHRTTPEAMAIEDQAKASRRGIWRLKNKPANPWCIRHHQPRGCQGPHPSVDPFVDAGAPSLPSGPFRLPNSG